MSRSSIDGFIEDEFEDYEDFTFPENFCFRIQVNFFLSLQGSAIDERLQRGYPSISSSLAARQLIFLLFVGGRGSIPPFPIREGSNKEEEADTDQWCVVVPPIEGPPPEVLNDIQEFKESNNLRKNQAALGRIFEVILISPPFTFNDWEVFITQFSEIFRVLNEVEDCPATLDEDASTYIHDVWMNNTNYFKFSIYNRQKTHFDLLTLQNLIVIWARYRRGIEGLIPSYRRSEGTTEQRRAKAPGRLLNGPITSTTVDEFRTSVYESTDAGYLQDVFEPNGPVEPRTKITFQNFVEYDRNGDESAYLCNEIQFREAAGSFRIQNLSFWMMFVMSVFKLSDDLAGQGLKFDSDKYEPSYTISELFDLFGASDEVYDYAITQHLYGD